MWSTLLLPSAAECGCGLWERIRNVFFPVLTGGKKQFQIITPVKNKLFIQGGRAGSPVAKGFAGYECRKQKSSLPRPDQQNELNFTTV